MKAELKAKWLAALRSGKYKQGAGSLYEEIDDSYCCIGVLCDVMGMQKGKIECFDGLVDWQTVGGMRVETASSLASMNDTGSSFTEIADYIEANIPADDAR